MGLYFSVIKSIYKAMSNYATQINYCIINMLEQALFLLCSLIWGDFIFTKGAYILHLFFV